MIRREGRSEKQGEKRICFFALFSLVIGVITMIQNVKLMQRVLNRKDFILEYLKMCFTQFSFGSATMPESFFQKISAM